MQLLQCCISPLSSHFQHVLKQLDGEKGLKTRTELKIIHLVEDHTGPLVTFLGMSNMSGVHAQVHTDQNNNHTNSAKACHHVALFQCEPLLLCKRSIKVNKVHKQDTNLCCLRQNHTPNNINYMCKELEK